MLLDGGFKFVSRVCSDVTGPPLGAGLRVQDRGMIGPDDFLCSSNCPLEFLSNLVAESNKT